MSSRLALRLPAPEQAILDALTRRATDERWAARLFDRDTSLWTADRDVAEGIADRLGWLDAPAHFTIQAAALEGFGDGIREAGFDNAVVMGMGGSSLAPDVLHRTFGTVEGYLRLRVLDSTDPAKSIDAIPHRDELREAFLNPPDIGGRYSALTYVGLVPASLIGIDVDALLAAGAAMLDACREPDATRNPR